MDKEKKVRKFASELTKTQFLPIQTSETKCALQYHRSCCQGVGYNLTNSGAFTTATLCSCVKNCALCLGHAQLLSENFAKSCIQPSPLKILNILNEASLPSRYAMADFPNFKNFTGNCPQVVQKLFAWEKSFHLGTSKGLLLSGPVGVGKTYLMACLVKALVRKGIRVKFTDFFHLLSLIKAAYSDQKSHMSVIGPLLDVDVLFIDELGKGKNSEFELTILDQLVMGRYNQNKIIVASTNVPLDEKFIFRRHHEKALDSLEEKKSQGVIALEDMASLKEKVGERIYSRLCETTIFVEIQGKDYRKQSVPQ